MSSFSMLTFALTNAAIATGLFCLIAALKPLVKNPALLHWLWLIVLIKFITPPLWSPKWEVFHAAPETATVPLREAAEPAGDRVGSSSEPPPAAPAISATTLPTATVAAQSASDEPSAQTPIASPRAHLQNDLSPPKTASTLPSNFSLPSSPFSLPQILPAIWLLAAGAWWALSLWRIWRFDRCLAAASFAPKKLQAVAQDLAAELGLRNPPQVLLAPGQLSPMLWALPLPGKSRALIIIPAELWKKLADPARRSLLLHELAHYRRGDHLVRWLEWFVMGAYFWFPLVWLLRREIRRAEELACDAEVVARSHVAPRAYAEMLVETIAFLSTDPAPLLATGIGNRQSLEERIKMIMRSSLSFRVSTKAKLLVGLLSLILLPLSPMLVRAQRAEETKPVAEKPQEPAAAVAETKKVDWLRGTGESLEIRIRGEILDAEGKGAEGAKLKVQHMSDGEASELIVAWDGSRFEVWVPLGKPKWSSIRFEGNSVDGKQAFTNRLLHYGIRQAAIDGMKLQLRPLERTMEIKVVDKTGSVEGAKVQIESRHLRDQLTITDKQGIARYPLFADDEPYQITAWTEDHRIGGYQFARQPTRDAKAAQHVIELNVCRPQKVRFIEDGANQPVAGLEFCLYVATPEPYFNYIGLIPASTMKTDSKGEAMYDYFPDWPKHHFYVDRLPKEWVKVGEETFAADGAIEVRVKRSKIAQRKQIAGRVRSFDGRHGGYYIEFRSFDGEEERRMDSLNAVSDAEGNFSLSVLPDAVYYGHVEDERNFSKTIDLLPYDSKTEIVTSPELTVIEGAPVEIFVSEGPNKKPIVNEYVGLFHEHSFTRMVGGEKRMGTGSHQWAALTDEKGIARGFALPDQPLRVSVSQLDWRMEKKVQPKDGRFERIELHRPIAGRLKVKGQLALPLGLDSLLDQTEMVFGAIDGQSMDYDRVKVDANGRFEFETVSPLFGIFAATKDHKAAVAKIVDTSTIEETLLLALEATGEYQGQILDEQGAPKVDYPVRATIVMDGKRKSETGSPTMFDAQVASTKTDSKGNFTLKGIPFGVMTAIYAGPGSDNGRWPLDRLVLDGGEKRPPAVHRLSSPRSATTSSMRPPLKSQFEDALVDAKAGGFRIMALLYQATPENREFVTQKLYDYDHNDDVAGFMHLFHRTTGDSVTPEDREFAKSKNWPEPAAGKIFACAMDASGKELGRIELDINDVAAGEKAAKFMQAFAPQKEDAKKKWDDAFALAAKTNRKVWVRVSQRFCSPCLILNRWIDEHKAELEKDFVILKVDNARDFNGPEVAGRFWDYKSGNGVPFHAIFDANGRKLIDSAGPLGNIGCPSGYEGGKHFRKMLESGPRGKLTNEEIEALIKSLPE